MKKAFVGASIDIGSYSALFSSILLVGEQIEMEFKSLRDGMAFTDRRLLVFTSQALRGKKFEALSFSWKAITAFSIENSSALDLDAELKFCGSGWGVCEVMLTTGTKVGPIAPYLAAKIFYSTLSIPALTP